jgi:large subunit ribosomal protein L18
VVFRSNKHIYAQAIDDQQGHTLASSSSKELKAENGSNKDVAKQVGLAVAQKLLDQSISQVVFDRGGYLYHGRVQAVADGAREQGLAF